MSRTYSSPSEKPAIKLQVSCVSIKGKRDSNQDSIYCPGLVIPQTDSHEAETTLTLGDASSGTAYAFAVCDGMGGESKGEVASALAVETMSSAFASVPDLGSYEERCEFVATVLRDANRRIADLADELLVSRMGTTAALLYTQNGTAFAANVGDSRVYLFRGGKLIQLTKDDTQARQFCEEGLLSPSEARKHPSSNALTQYVGMNAVNGDIIPHFSEELALQKDDIFVICSDGVDSGIDDKELRSVIKSSLPGKCRLFSRVKKDTPLARAIVEKAHNTGSKDNISVVTVRVI